MNETTADEPRARVAVLEAERDALKANLASLKPSGQVAEDEATIRAFLPEDSIVTWAVFKTALSRLAKSAQTLETLRAHRWKCQCGLPVKLAEIIVEISK